MNKEKLFQLLDQGEGFTVEYKSCKNSLSKSVFETVCSFSNRYGGYILLGVEETTKDGRKVGEIVGVNENCIYDMQRNFITTLNDLNFFVPSIYISLEKFCIDGKTILYCYVPFSSQLTRCNGRVFDRNGDADIDITKSTDLVANVLNRKSNSFKERQILPYVNDDDLELDLLDTVRKMTLIKKDHPWQSMNDKELLRSAGLYGKDLQTGAEGYNLAAVLLLGKDATIKFGLPAYKTDAIYRVVNLDRYDDREIVDCNLIKAYDRLVDFVSKHTNDPFYLEGTQRISIRDIIVRELVSNSLIHRDYSSAFPAKIIVTKDAIFTENWSISKFHGNITLDNFEPYPKNPILANFFINIGRADLLGSGTKNLFKYTQIYCGEDPTLTEGDVFKVSVPLKLTDISSADAFIKKMRNSEYKHQSEHESEHESQLGHQSEHVSEYEGKQDTKSNSQFNLQVERLEHAFSSDKIGIVSFSQLLEFCKIPRTRQEMQDFCKISSRSLFTLKYLKAMVELGVLERTIKDSNKNRNQKYFTK